jgi:hypothetical protein
MFNKAFGASRPVYSKCLLIQHGDVMYLFRVNPRRRVPRPLRPTKALRARGLYRLVKL